MKNIIRFFNQRILFMKLRTKVSLFFIFPMLITLCVTFYIQSIQEQQAWQKLTNSSAMQVADITLASLQHAMLVNDRGMLADILTNIGSKNPSLQILLIDLGGEVIQSSDLTSVGNVEGGEQTGCEACHQIIENDQLTSIRVNLPGDRLRIVVPIPNDPQCQACHVSSNIHLGVLLVDSSQVEANDHFSEIKKINFWITVISLVMIFVMAQIMVIWLVENRIGRIANSLSSFASGDHSARVPRSWHTRDEITSLAENFNSMADQLTRQEQEAEERTLVREKAIVEERERIGRELHDGIAQFISYILSKSQAVRLFMEKDQLKKARENLLNIEEETRKQALDVRGSILGLKAFTRPGRGLSYDIEEFLEQSNRFMDVQIKYELDPDVNLLDLNGETRLQFLRILQEAISNIRKHSKAGHAWVTLELTGPDLLEMTIRDDGVGFELDAENAENEMHFGLATMQERAQSASAEFLISSEYNMGTIIRIRLRIAK
jgi:signal transduction histidine kinase